MLCRIITTNDHFIFVADSISRVLRKLQHPIKNQSFKLTPAILIRIKTRRRLSGHDGGRQFSESRKGVYLGQEAPTQLISTKAYDFVKTFASAKRTRWTLSAANLVNGGCHWRSYCRGGGGLGYGPYKKLREQARHSSKSDNMRYHGRRYRTLCGIEKAYRLLCNASSKEDRHLHTRQYF